MTEPGLPARAWVAWFRTMRRWNRYRVVGLETLLNGPPALIVGYHGRPIAHDLAMLLDVVHDELGYWPHPIFHKGFAANPMLSRFLDDMGFVSGDDGTLAAAVARGEHIVVTPGGTREGLRPAWVRYRVDWGRRAGYLRLALKYGLDVVPAAGWGVDDVFMGLNDGYRLGRRLGVPSSVPLWVGVGSTGVWPLALPLPVKVTTVLGERISLPPIDIDDDEALQALHERVVGAVQSLLDARPGAQRRSA